MKRMDVEKALAWTYCEELPKTPRPGGALRTLGLPAVWRRVSQFGELLEVVDDDGINQWGVLADPLALTAPDYDAIAIHEAAVRLGALAIDFPEDWNPLSDLDLGEDLPAILVRARERLTVRDRDGRPRLKTTPVRLLQTGAILGPPHWECVELPVRSMVKSAYGEARWFRRTTIVTAESGAYEVEVDGFDSKKRRPYADAYRKFFWDPDPVELAVDRGLFEIWRNCLDLLVLETQGSLGEIELVPSARSARPWEHPDALPRVLPWLAMPA